MFKISKSKLQIDIICTIVQWRISATSPFAPIFFLAYKKESIDYFSSVSSSSIQHYLRKKINKTGQNHLERILEAFRRHLEGMRGLSPLNKN